MASVLSGAASTCRGRGKGRGAYSPAQEADAGRRCILAGAQGPIRMAPLFLCREQLEALLGAAFNGFAEFNVGVRRIRREERKDGALAALSSRLAGTSQTSEQRRVGAEDKMGTSLAEVSSLPPPPPLTPFSFRHPVALLLSLLGQLAMPPVKAQCRYPQRHSAVIDLPSWMQAPRQLILSRDLRTYCYSFSSSLAIKLVQCTPKQERSPIREYMKTSR